MPGEGPSALQNNPLSIWNSRSGRNVKLLSPSKYIILLKGSKRKGEPGELGTNQPDFSAQRNLGVKSQAICLLAPRKWQGDK